MRLDNFEFTLAPDLLSLFLPTTTFKNLKQETVIPKSVIAIYNVVEVT
jgi:hypothetical protein